MDEKNQRRKPKNPDGASSIYKGKDGYWHGRVTMGVKDDGTPDRRHVKRKEYSDCVKGVRDLERQRESGRVEKAGQRWTVATWLTHWLDNVAKESVGPNAWQAYAYAVRLHLVPKLGSHKLKALKPEHLERMYTKAIAEGRSASYVHQWHRTIRTALGEAERRGYIARNPASLARPPKIVDKEVEPYTVEEMRRILETAAKDRNSARWAIALALGLRQGEVLGLKWIDIDFETNTLQVRRTRLRPDWEHGCENGTCGTKAGYCPQRRNRRPETGPTKSSAGNRAIGLPGELAALLKQQRAEQAAERAHAGDQWQEGGWVFTRPNGRSLVLRSDWQDWKTLIKAAGVPNKRLHDARHTAATVLLSLQVAERTSMGIMGWSSSAMVKRYQHVVDPIRQDVAKRVGEAIWKAAADTDAETEGGDSAPE
jgi:integrase